MFIRRKLNKSGSFGGQVFDKRAGRNALLRSFGSSRDESELISIEREASDFLSRFGVQGVIDFDEDLTPLHEEEAELFFNRIIDVRQAALRINWAE